MEELISSRYMDQAIAFLTQHGKEHLVAPILEPSLGCRIHHVNGYDTDQLGTFTGEIQRIENQINTARKKAQIGLSLAQTAIGIASEGSFTADPFGGLMPWNIEVMLWLDTQRNQEIVGIAQGPARNTSRTVDNLADLKKCALEAGFPSHHLVLKSQDSDKPLCVKGIRDWDTLDEKFLFIQSQSGNKTISVESDLRAFCNPTRQAMIQKAAKDLLQKLTSMCPQCSSTGFWMTGHDPGLPCRVCNRPTKLALQYKWGCAVCGYQETRSSQTMNANPENCDFCNP